MIAFDQRQDQDYVFFLFSSLSASLRLASATFIWLRLEINFTRDRTDSGLSNEEFTSLITCRANKSYIVLLALLHWVDYSSGYYFTHALWAFFSKAIN